MREAPDVSVIIPTKGRARALLDCVESIVGQSTTPGELVIVDQGEGDKLQVAVAAQLRAGPIQMVYRWCPELSGLAQARNVGFQASGGSLVVFLDDDVILEPDYLEEILRVYNTDKEDMTGGVGGWIVNEPVARWWFERWFLRGPFRDARPEFRLKPVERFRSNALSGCNMSYRRDVYARHPANEALTRYSLGEDWDIGVRASRTHELILTNRARLQHLASPLQRLSVAERLAMLVRNQHFLYSTNHSPAERRKWRNRVCLAWFRLGIVLLMIQQASRGRRETARALLTELIWILKCDSTEKAEASSSALPLPRRTE